MFRRTVSLVVAWAAMFLSVVAPASANTVDDAFIAALDSYPVPYSTSQNAITLARAVCDSLAAGESPDAVAIAIGQPANWTVTQSVFFVQTSAQTYCAGPASTAPASAGQAAPPVVAPAPIVQPQAPMYPLAPAPSSVYFSNCSAARSAGAAPLYAGQAGYRSALDRDGDGVACE